MYGMYGRSKFILFIIGILVTVVSLVGLALAFNFVPAFLEVLPADSRIYFGITAVLGIIALFSSFSRY